MTDKYTFQTNRIPTWVSDLIFKYQTQCMLYKMYFGLHFYLVRLVMSRETFDENIPICNPKYKKPVELELFIEVMSTEQVMSKSFGNKIAVCK
jgi:hypothetical protein